MVPFGPWQDFDACMTDAAMQDAYPEDARRRICGALQDRLHARRDTHRPRSDEGEVKEVRITEEPGYWIVHDVVVTRRGVNLNGHNKLDSFVEASPPVLEGSPLVYGHPRAPDGEPVVEVDPLEAVGHCVNAHAKGDRVVCDWLLFRDAPPDYKTKPEALELNERLVEVLRDGGSVTTSPGFYALERDESGEAEAQEGGRRRYNVVQEAPTLYGHVAILAPLHGSNPSCPLPGCGVGAGVHADEALPVACCGECLEDFVAAFMDEYGVSRTTALWALRQAAHEANDVHR